MIGEILGVRRETVGLIAGYFQRSGHIAYVRGCIDILNRDGLEDISCECYRVIRKELDDVFR
ncbi:helix-turn-helix domain-containing protein [Nitrospira moscoviensis]|uniref:HTH crp-type domain-containing protein n=1 Tax=Nitrospira moscoviensis TaxID=42253 RepID=A0A0K2GFD7_NITMO|nr:helix-turn-helix domain-containing protein [Nitrospira moscoviensis]ALA59666.1 hypothetical protein NITMOv2_3273 [Nitrospira moscoviensis]